MLLNVAWLVTPFVGVWIETLMTSLIDLENSVTPFVGVWIETDGISNFTPKPKSHPSWVCGLKQTEKKCFALLICHTLRGCVD